MAAESKSTRSTSRTKPFGDFASQMVTTSTLSDNAGISPSGVRAFQGADVSTEGAVRAVDLDGADNVKIADFGLAALAYGRSAPIGATVHEDASFLQHTKCGSLMYAAPEVLASTKESGYDAAKADVWSLGIILYSMLSGALPFEVALASCLLEALQPSVLYRLLAV